MNHSLRQCNPALNTCTNTYIFSLCMSLIAWSTALAEVRLPRFFVDNMVLQQNQTNTIWGWADPGEEVVVRASWEATTSTVTDSEGRWKVFLKTPSHGTGHSLCVDGSNTTVIKNVAVGEVWLCLGQSNMGWSVQNSFEADSESAVDLPNLRIFKSAREHWHKPLEENRDRLCVWKSCTPESAMETSAVAYFFGKKLHQELGIPVGIIQRAYAGTPIEGWLPWDEQKNDPRSKAQKKLLEDTASRMAEKRGETVEKAIATFHSELAIYNAKIDSGETMKNKFRQLAPPIITRPATLGHQFPGNIFNTMVAPVTPFGIRGIVWYQGERNSKNVPQALHYQHQLETLVNFYRKEWHQKSNGHMPEDFPVQITQLPSWHAPQSTPTEGVESPWVVNRESMRLATKNLPNTHMAVSIDTGDAIALHPKNKKPIGIRHAIIALKNTYGKCSVGEGPRYIAHKIEKGEILIEFGSVGSGLQPARPEPLSGFAIAGSDRQWHWAEAKITGNTVIVSSADVLKPVAVRYAWAMNPSQRNLLYNKEGLPASPFRTDNWQLYNPKADIIEVTKPEKPSAYIPQDWNRPVMKP